ncbi:MAG: hypothetical protein C4B56_06895 [Candidatus Methanophagaceae archaeon]|nr:MAG: hypothetical protein C4B56_06895 [Methanophagales archaeon]
MTMNQNAFIASTDAQVFAIGAVMLITIVVITATIYFAINAPVNTKTYELQHSEEVIEDFFSLRASINMLRDYADSLIQQACEKAPEICQRHSSMSSKVRSNALTSSVSIKSLPTGDSFIALPPASGNMNFSPADGKVVVSLSDSDSSTNVSCSCVWEVENFTGNYSVEYGTVNTSSNGNLTPEGPPYASATVCIPGNFGFDTGSNNTVYKNITWYAENVTGYTDIILKVRTDMFPDMRHATGWDECYSIKSSDYITSGKGRGSFPLYDLTSVSKGHRYVQLRIELKSYDPQKAPTLVNFSIGYNHTTSLKLGESSGSITFSAPYHYLPGMSLTYENGAVIKSQTEGEFVDNRDNRTPPFMLSLKKMPDNRTRISMTLVNLTGKEVPGRSGEDVLVRLWLANRELIANGVFYPNITINITSRYYRAYAKWFNETLREANMCAEDYELMVNDTQRTVSVEFYGKEHGVELYLEKITVQVGM